MKKETLIILIDVFHVLLVIVSLVLLIVWLAPMGLLILADSAGIDVGFIVDLNDWIWVLFGLFISVILLTPVYYKNPRGMKMAVWVVFGLAVLNMHGCSVGLKSLNKNVRELRIEKALEDETSVSLPIVNTVESCDSFIA